MKAFLGLVGRHPGAFSYDWRTRFGLPLSAVFDGRMSFREAWMLTQELIVDPSSRVFVAVAETKHPWTREAFILADLVDITRYANTPKKRHRSMKPYDRPIESPNRDVTRSKRPVIDQHRVRAELAIRGHRPTTDKGS